MSANEIALGLTWLQSTLGSDTTLQGYCPGGVWRSLAPPSTVPPFVITSLQAGSATTTMNGVRLIVEALFQIRATGPAVASATIISASVQIDTLLGGIYGLRNIMVPGGAILSCYQDSPLQRDELVNGEVWTNFGGLWRLQIESE